MKKELGQIFTPDSIASFILDEIGYNEDCILTKKIIEPSFGDGAFLKIITERLINVALKNHYKKSQIAALIRDNIYGFEIDTNVYSTAIKNLKLLLEKYSVPYSINTFINHKNTDALIEYKNYLHFFDFVVGNPPYVRIKNLPNNEKMLLKSFRFTTGTTDLYIAFFELAFSIISENGKIGYITPNSFLYNSSQSSFRSFLFNSKFVEKIYNFEKTLKLL